jgi:hypothetical protein
MSIAVPRRALLFALALAGLCAAALALPAIVRAAEVTVCPSGCDSSTVQGGIDAANPGDTVSVHDLGREHPPPDRVRHR